MDHLSFILGGHPLNLYFWTLKQKIKNEDKFQCNFYPRKVNYNNASSLNPTRWCPLPRKIIVKLRKKTLVFNMYISLN